MCLCGNGVEHNEHFLFHCQRFSIHRTSYLDVSHLIKESATTLSNSLLCTTQSQKTQGCCVTDFATLSDERRSHSKIFPLFIWIKEPCVRKFEGLERSKLLGISQTTLYYLVTNQFNDITNKLILEPTVDFCKKAGRFKCISKMFNGD